MARTTRRGQGERGVSRPPVNGLKFSAVQSFWQLKASRGAWLRLKSDYKVRCGRNLCNCNCNLATSDAFGVWQSGWCSATNDKRQISLQLQQCWCWWWWSAAGNRQEGPEGGEDREQTPWWIAKPQKAGQLLLAAAVSCGKDTQKPSQGKGKYWHSLSECSRRQAGSQG